MKGRRTIVGLCMLCALAISAFAAQSAAAATKGTTAFTCKVPVAGETSVGTPFTKEHCKDADTSAGGTFRHVQFNQDTTTQITGTNEKTSENTAAAEPTFLESTISGVAVKIEAKKVHGTGTMANKKDAVTGEHYAHGTGKIVYEEAKMLAPAKCELEKTKYETEELTATTQGISGAGTEEGMGLKFKPTNEVTNLFITFFVQGAECPAAIKGEYKVTGSVVGNVDGATTTFTEANTTAQNSLKIKGSVKAGVIGKLTISGKDEAKGDTSYTPLSATTVETP